MEISDKIKSLLLKIKALADSGVGGEKENAHERLNFLLRKYNVSMSDLESEEIKDFEYSSEHQYRHIIIQVCASLRVPSFYKRRSRTCIIIECTNSQYIEICDKVDHYIKAYKEQLEIFNTAFYYKYNLYDMSGTKKPKSEDIDFERIRSMQKMASSMKDDDYILKLE